MPLNQKINKTSGSRNTHQLVTKTTDDIGNKFRALAAAEGKSVADVLRELVESYCED